MDLQILVGNFINELEYFAHEMDHLDRKWRFIFPRKNAWHFIHVTRYKKDVYISLVDGELETLEINEHGEISNLSFWGARSPAPSPRWANLIASAIQWLTLVKKDWIKANRQAHKAYPLNRRKGIVPHAIVRALFDNIYRIDIELGKAKTKKFIRILESGYFYDDAKTMRDSISAADFFEYCKIAYTAGKREDDVIDLSLTGRQMYERYADGRSDGLLDIDEKSPQAFADWIDGKHPKETLNKCFVTDSNRERRKRYFGNRN